MRYFPVFVDVAGKRIVMVGGGEEALRKLRLLLKTEARLEVIAESLHPEIAANPRIAWISDVFLPDILDGAALVFAAEPQLNEAVAAAAQARGIPVNIVDEAHLSTFIVPSIVDRDPVVVAIGTEGAAPVLAQGLRAKVDALLPEHLGDLTRKAASLRDLAAAQVPAGSARRAFWQDYFFGRVAEASATGDEVAYELALGDSLFNHAQGAKGRLSVIIPPADLELLTLKAQRRLMEADVIINHAGSLALMEMARRDALRGTALAEALDHATHGRNAVVIAASVAGLEAAAHARGLVLEVLDHASHQAPTPFPVREDLRDAILRAAS